MQDYTYSIFSSAAIVIHLIINYRQLIGRGVDMGALRVMRYRGFLMGVFFYYVADAAWGVFAGLGWTGSLYVDTILFFLSLVAFVLMWCRFIVVYLDLGKWLSRILLWSGYAILAVNVVLLTANFSNGCVFHIDEQGRYIIGCARNPAISLLIVYNVLMAAFVLANALVSREEVRRRSMMVFLFCLTIAVAIVLQIIWPLTPFTALGCLISNCFFHVFVVQDEQAAKHTAELEDALRRARAAEKARSMFFSIVSHDIRTPLNAILGYSELIQNSIKSQAERDEALESIHASGTTLLQLVNDVLDLAKMDAGHLPLRPEPVRLQHLTDEVFASFRLAASGKGIELVNQTADVPMVLLDEHRFRQILFNLVGNAVKFTERGSVKVSASYSGAELVVSVEDTGCGIPQDMQTHIFDPFVQVQDPSHAADRAAGTGLGLSICKRLIEAMGGELVVESELGRGSTFKLRIPMVKVVDATNANASESGNQSVKQSNRQPICTLHVLVVDDSPVNRSVLTAHLKREGVGLIDCACDGAEALAKLETAVKEGNPHDFVFSDFWMPNMNGAEFIRKLRADSRFSKLPVVLVTADTEFHRVSETSLFSGILLKPVTHDKLMDVFAKNHDAFSLS